MVQNFKTHFTWDNEKRENSKSYLFDWSYYNGVVFEGLEYVYEVTEDKAYKEYVIEYMSSMINSNGTWAYCTNSGYTGKVCAGYNATHGADCYKTASLLLDAYEMTGDKRYLTVAETLYADLDAAAQKYSLKNAGNNYRHTWETDSNPDLWLDGLYMILPFRAEYAKYSNDQDELDLIVDRMQWVSDNMYNSDKGLFYHAADSATSNSGTFWLRSIGWYAAAIVDIMDSMEGENLNAMKKQLVKLVDGMKACQNKTNGMWLNNMAASQSSSNPYETSGTALVCYAVMKAVNNGWLDKSYADMAILAFKGICDEKLKDNNLTDICFKGAPGSSNSTFYDNEGKGLGPFIMFYAEVLNYYNGNPVTGITVTPPSRVSYVQGESMVLNGMVVTATHINGKQAEVLSYHVSGYDAYKLGEQTITVTYEGHSATFTVTVYEDPAADITMQTFYSEYEFASVTAAATGAKFDRIIEDAAADALLSYWYGYDISLTEQVEGTDATITLYLDPEEMGSENYAVYYYNAETGAYEAVSGHSVGVDEDGVEYITIPNAKLGKYIYGTPAQTIPENAKLEKLVITAPTKTKYFLETEILSASDTVYLDIAGLSVIAVFSDGTEKELGWNEFQGAVDGYTLTFAKIQEAGTYTVTVSYTYEGVTATQAFTIEVYHKFFESADQEVSLEVAIPGVTAAKITENTAAMSGILGGKVAKYASYEIKLTGYNQGEAVTVTLPVPAGFDTSKLVGVSIEDGVVVLIEGIYNAEDRTFSFVSNHFSTKAVAEKATSYTGSGTLVGSSVYTLAQNGVTAGKQYLIVNTKNNGDGFALTNNNDGTAGRTTVKISNNTITVEDDTYIAWTFSDSTSGTVSNNDRYLYPGNGSLSLNTNGTNLTISNRQNGAYRIYYSQRQSFYSTYYYLRYNNGWTGASARQESGIGSVYLFELTSSSAGDTVNFTVTPGSTNLMVGGTTNLYGEVLLNDERVDLSECTITWANSNSSAATFQDGLVTGVADGSTTITATLTAVSGKALDEAIELQIPITVQSKQITDKELVGNHPIVIKSDEIKSDKEPDYSNIKLQVTYDDGTTGEIPSSQLTFASIDPDRLGNYIVTIQYAGETVGNVAVTVVEEYPENDPNGIEYPVYPNDGAVRIDKYSTEKDFENTGIVNIELDVAGVSIKSAVDVILVTDLSNSMAWGAGGRTDATTHEDTKMYDLAQSVGSFANIFLANDEEGNATKNTMTLVTFGGYDADYTNKVYTAYADPTQTLLLGVNSAETVKNTKKITLDLNGKTITGIDKATEKNFYLIDDLLIIMFIDLIANFSIIAKNKYHFSVITIAVAIHIPKYMMGG